MNLAVVDICILAVVLLGGAWGLAMGLTRAVVGPLALLMAITAAFAVYPRVAQLFQPVGGDSLKVEAFSLLIAFLMALVVFGLINRSLATVVKAGGLTAANHLIGLLTGLALGSFVAGAGVYYGWNFADPELRPLLRDSQFAPLVLRFFSILSLWGEHLLPPLSDGV